MAAEADETWRRFLSPSLIAILLLGFTSGLPLALTASTLSIWLAEEGISKTSIGLFGGIGIAYTFKFLWSPLVDRMQLPLLTRKLGRRRGWLLFSQGLLAIFLVTLGFYPPAAGPWMTAALALAVACASATQDIAFDAFRVESLPRDLQADGSAVAVLGYRIGMIVSSAGALYLAAAFGWQAAYGIMGALMGIGMLTVLARREPVAVDDAETAHASPVTWFIEPLKEFMRRPGWLALLLFVFFYKLPDAFLGILANPYYLEVGFAKTQIADVAKIYGLLATIAGGFAGAWLVHRLGLIRTLWIGGIACAATNLLFIPLQAAGPQLLLLAGVITLDNISGGISVTALVAYMSGLTNRQFTATQYALLSSLVAAARTVSAMPAGYVADTAGWTFFFVFSALLALPGLLLLFVISRRQTKLLPEA